jgi:HSP20 family protein
MSLVRWDPFAEVDSLFNRMMMPRMGRWPRLAVEGESGVMFEWSPSADISETEKEYLIRAELPGMKKEDVKVTVGDGVLTIEGERKQQKDEKSERFHRVETHYGSFTRTFSLPDNVKSDQIRCESKEGVLTVHIPKTEQKKPKEIQVQ